MSEEEGAEIQQLLDTIVSSTFGAESMEGWEDLPPIEKSYSDLSEKELLILALAIRGFGYQDIARLVKANLGFVKHTLEHKCCQELLAKVDDMLESEIKTMKGLAVKTMRDVMQNGTYKDRMTAVEKYFKVSGRFDGEQKGKTAEDVISKMLDIMQQQTDITKNLTEQNLQSIIGRTNTGEVEDLEIIEQPGEEQNLKEIESNVQ